MKWSMGAVSYRMSGSGSWQNLLPDEQARKRYAGIYPYGIPAVQAREKLGQYLDPWERTHIIRLHGRRIIPTGPIMTDNDLEILKGWFKDISDDMTRAVEDNLPAYRHLALDLAGRRASERSYVDNILTIMICALTLDSRVFSLLRQELMGTYPGRGLAGTFFFWGYGFSGGPSRIYGFTTYGSWQGPPIHVLRSHELDREVIKSVLRRRNTVEFIQGLAGQKEKGSRPLSEGAIHPAGSSGIIDDLRQAQILEEDDPLRLNIPVFSDPTLFEEGKLVEQVSERIKHGFMSRISDLHILLDRCSFRQCTRADVYCMLFHLSYSFAADKLVAYGTIPDFPESAGGEWGVWIH